MQTFTFRLKSGQDLFEQIEAVIAERNIEAGCVLSAVGSLTHATLRLANREVYSEYEGHFEIVSMTGTVSIHGSHLHISISDGDGQTIGGQATLKVSLQSVLTGPVISQRIKSAQCSP